MKFKTTSNLTIIGKKIRLIQRFNIEKQIRRKEREIMELKEILEDLIIIDEDKYDFDDEKYPDTDGEIEIVFI